MFARSALRTSLRTFSTSTRTMAPASLPKLNYGLGVSALVCYKHAIVVGC